MNSKSKIYIAGHTGLVGSAIIRELKKNGFQKIITATRSQLDLINQQAVLKFLKRKKPDFIVIAAAITIKSGFFLFKNFRTAC